MKGRNQGKPDQDAADASLLEKVAGGDLETFRTLFDRYYPRIYRFILQIVRRPELAEEATNDTLLEVWRGARRFRGESKVSTWIYGIAYHEALNALRGVRNSAHVDLEAAEGMPAPAGDPEEAAEAWQRQDRVRKALAELSAAHRTVLELAFFHGLAYAEIAQVLGCPENTVKTRIFHAKRRLGRMLAAMEG